MIDIAFGLGIALSASIINASTPPNASYEQEKYNMAQRAAVEASYKACGGEDYVKRMEERHVPKDIRELTGWGIIVVRSVTEQRITLKWGF